jgi:hypothetical protein
VTEKQAILHMSRVPLFFFPTKSEQPEAAKHVKDQRRAFLKVGAQSALEWLSGSRATSCTGPFSCDRKTGHFAHVARATFLFSSEK